MSKISDERLDSLEAIIHELAGNVAAGGPEDRAWAIINDLRSGGEEKNGVDHIADAGKMVGVGVKPLEWLARGKFVEFASTPFGEYTVEYYEENDGCGWEAVYDETGTLGHFPRDIDAKAAAQADYERRILSALTNTDLSLRAENERLRAALEKIDAIRNSIVGFQNVGWSDHIYPLVGALEEAGFHGAGYDKMRHEIRTMLAAEEKLEEAAKVLEPWANLADVALAEAPHDAFHFQAFVDSTGTVHMISLDHARSTKSFLANLKGAE